MTLHLGACSVDLYLTAARSLALALALGHSHVCFIKATVSAGRGEKKKKEKAIGHCYTVKGSQSIFTMSAWRVSGATHTANSNTK